jgi:hypothetical protein
MQASKRIQNYRSSLFCISCIWHESFGAILLVEVVKCREQDRRYEMDTEIQAGGKDDLMNCTLQPFLISCYIPKRKFMIIRVLHCLLCVNDWVRDNSVDRCMSAGHHSWSIVQ